jgi:hypothetical protein
MRASFWNDAGILWFLRPVLRRGDELLCKVLKGGFNNEAQRVG